METLTQFRDRAAKDLSRWHDELDGERPRATLTVGIVKQVFSFAEELLRRSATIYLSIAADVSAEAVATVTGGKKKTFSKPTFGLCVQLLIYLDSHHGLGSNSRVISKADQALFENLLSSRNAFAHGSLADAMDINTMRMLIDDVLRLSRTKIVQLAALKEVH